GGARVAPIPPLGGSVPRGGVHEGAHRRRRRRARPAATAAPTISSLSRATSAPSERPRPKTAEGCAVARRRPRSFATSDRTYSAEEMPSWLPRPPAPRRGPRLHPPLGRPHLI